MLIKYNGIWINNEFLFIAVMPLSGLWVKKYTQVGGQEGAVWKVFPHWKSFIYIIIYFCIDFFEAN